MQAPKIPPMPAQPSQRLVDAVNRLATAAPHLSARTVVTLGQAVGIAVVAGLVTGVSLVSPMAAVALTTALMTLPFTAVVSLRLIALSRLTLGRSVSDRSSAPVGAPSDWPVYTILVALHREAPVVAQLVKALTALDYPPERLDIRLVVEGDDGETRAALDAIQLPPQMTVVVVPPAEPRTKPKALTYALADVRGAYVAVYDAEDLPEPDQLKRALAVFGAAPDWPATPIGCVQARLRIHNAGQSFLSGQFALEYFALFDALLPTIVALRLPVPLRRGQFGLAVQAVGIPLTWILISLAAYRAVGQLLSAPHVWEKTRHGAAFASGSRRGIG